MFKADRNKPVDKIDISKKYIESKVSQEELMKYYLGTELNFDNNFCSPLRSDNNPTCSLYKKNGNIYMKDWAGHFQGDCYNLVCYHNHLNYGDLMGAMKIIIRDFADRFLGVNGTQDSYIKAVIADTNEEQGRQKRIQIKKQVWKPEQVDYWKSYGFTLENLSILPSVFLAQFDVFSCEYVWIENRIVYSYSKSDPAIAYYFGNGRYKIYFPNRDKKFSRFITNSTAIQGYNQLPETGKLLILTKSMKDVMVLKMIGYSACALQSEQHDFTKEAYEHLSNRFEKIVLLYDNDDAGRKGATKICDKYNLTYIEVPEDFEGCKDISDVAREYSVQDAHDCMFDLTYMWT